jgi:hypothetical protein
MISPEDLLFWYIHGMVSGLILADLIGFFR